MPESKHDPRDTATKIQTLRIYLKRTIDRLFDASTDPQFTGSVSISWSAKEGRPDHPRQTVERYGIVE